MIYSLRFYRRTNITMCEECRCVEFNPVEGISIHTQILQNVGLYEGEKCFVVKMRNGDYVAFLTFA